MTSGGSGKSSSGLRDAEDFAGVQLPRALVGAGECDDPAGQLLSVVAHFPLAFGEKVHRNWYHAKLVDFLLIAADRFGSAGGVLLRDGIRNMMGVQ